MTELLTQALRGARHELPGEAVALPRLLLVGGGGALGSAVLEHALPAGRFARVQALVAGPLASALRGFEPLDEAALHSSRALEAELAVIVFERRRHSNGRDDAFVMPEPADLLPLATALRRGGVRALLVVVPHAPALLPQALRLGFASLDEGAVAALGFEQLVFLRAGQAAAVDGPRRWLQRVADAWLTQLRWMVPQREQPLRAAVLARCVVALARALPAAPPGTRVLAPELLWQATQPGVDTEAVLAAWLHGAALPAPP
ncbi:MAG: hypothetical protein KF683_10940 [Rubrivivax sp.]|nr:hypothetical protein [Rubrivivax sp.]